VDDRETSRAENGTLIIQANHKDNGGYTSAKNETRGWKTWPFYRDFYLILNLAIGGTWQGANGIDDSVFPVQMVIDYVRVYQTDLEKPGYDTRDYEIKE
jgi:hypothetical protein